MGTGLASVIVNVLNNPSLTPDILETRMLKLEQNTRFALLQIVKFIKEKPHDKFTENFMCLANNDNIKNNKYKKQIDNASCKIDRSMIDDQKSHKELGEFLMHLDKVQREGFDRVCYFLIYCENKNNYNYLNQIEKKYLRHFWGIYNDISSS